MISHAVLSHGSRQLYLTYQRGVEDQRGTLSCCSSSICSRTRLVCGSTGLSSDGALKSWRTPSLCTEPVVLWERSVRNEKSGRSWNRRESGSLFSGWKKHRL